MLARSIKTVGVIGGGSAGYISALYIKKHFPSIRVTVIESSKIPVVGVGEATTQPMARFLHKTMGFPVREFFQQTRPTFKLGVRFVWGKKSEDHYNNPFGSVNLAAAMDVTGDQANMSLNSMLMEAGKSPLIRVGGKVVLPRLGEFAYHIDNRHFLGYMRGKLAILGCGYMDAEIAEVKKRVDGSGVEHLVLADGTRQQFDLYVDCSGFRSLLLGSTLGVPWIDFSPSLMTDRAVVGTRETPACITPYTSATTLAHGWLWNTPMQQEEHLGYVFSSKHCSEEEALAELQRHCNSIQNGRVIKFRAGRHKQSWVGNVLGIGNAYAFIEPLESTGLHMILTQLTALRRALGADALTAPNVDRYNTRMGARWDSLRWFIALHFRFNGKMNTPFWEEYREHGDITGLAEYVEYFKNNGPLGENLDSPLYQSMNLDTTFRISAHDAVLAGCGVNKWPMRIPRPHIVKAFTLNYRLNQSLVARALGHRESLEFLSEHECEFLESGEHDEARIG